MATNDDCLSVGDAVQVAYTKAKFVPTKKKLAAPVTSRQNAEESKSKEESPKKKGRTGHVEQELCNLADAHWANVSSFSVQQSLPKPLHDTFNQGGSKLASDLSSCYAIVLPAGNRASVPGSAGF